MAVKELLNQSRNPFNWARAIVLAVYVLPFPWIYSRIVSYRFPETVAIAGYVSGLTFLTLVDASPSPTGSEGNRLTLYLTAPTDLPGILRAKLAVFLTPLLAEGLLLSLALGLWLQVSPGDLLYVVMLVALIIVVPTTVLIWGSAWDEDLNLPVEGGMAALIHEQIPATPRRIWLINLGILLFAAMLLLAWKLPAPLALPALALLDAAVMTGAWQFGRRYIQRKA